jgi:hypothetical protein
MRYGRAFSIFELMVVTTLVAIFSMTALMNLRLIDNPARSAAFTTASFIKRARGQAIGTTSAVRLSADGESGLRTFTSTSCENLYPGPLWEVNTQKLSFPKGVRLGEVLDVPHGDSYSGTSISSWHGICFSPRGLADENIRLRLSDGIKDANMEILIGGGVIIE